ncbi:permease [Paenibacillus sp. CCS19]|uniref:ABC transporter permease n=1 Tax=Paenibacillus sp. CCS19 TaxID=3158387 RepID=UPI002563E921|nr:ABC transporter permease [Paenibacillus cellulosilyticus]GMK38875.1 permease [Paenibacillus cellulosilyticus]
MSKLWRKSLRDMLQAKGQFIAFVLIIAVGAFFYAGLVTYSSNLSAYAEDYFQEHQLSDLYVSYDQLSTADVAALRSVDGIRQIEGRYTLDATQTWDGYKATLAIHSIPADNRINTPTLLVGRLPSNKQEIILDSHYAAEHQYTVGDQIRMSAGERRFTFTISGLCENVEHAKLSDTQDHQIYGAAYIAEAAIPVISGGSSFNEVMIIAEDDYDLEELGQAVEEQSNRMDLPSLDIMTKEQTFNYSQISATIYNNKLMSRVIPFVLFVIEAIILFLAMSRMIDSQRKQVGIMKALGVRNRSIMLHYMNYPILVSIMGSVVGCVLAAVLFVPMIRESNARAYSLPGIAFSMSLYSVLPPLLLSAAFGMLACYFSSRSILKEHAAQAMRPKPPKKMKKLVIERIPGLWQSISYSYKLIVRNIALNKQKALASSIGVVVSTVLLITAFGTQTALLKVASQTEEVFTYDLRIDYKMGTSPDKASLPSGITSSYELSSNPVVLLQENEKENATLIVTEPGNRLIHYFDADNREMSLMNDGVLVPQSYADYYQIEVGDIIKLKFTAPAMNNRTVEMKVAGLSTQYSNPSFYGTPAYLKSLGIDYRPTSLLVQVDNAEKLESVRTFFEHNPNVDTIADQQDLQKSAQYIVKQNNFVFIMFIVSAIILSFGAIYTISSINIYERHRELATLKVLGYQRGKIYRLIFLENVALTVFAAIVALPISSYVYGIIIQALSSTHQQIPNQLSFPVIVVSIIAAFTLTILSNLMLRGKVTNINMIESLKSVE